MLAWWQTRGSIPWQGGPVIAPKTACTALAPPNVHRRPTGAEVSTPKTGTPEIADVVAVAAIVEVMRGRPIKPGGSSRFQEAEVQRSGGSFAR